MRRTSGQRRITVSSSSTPPIPGKSASATTAAKPPCSMAANASGPVWKKSPDMPLVKSAARTWNSVQRGWFSPTNRMCRFMLQACMRGRGFTEFPFHASQSGLSRFGTGPESLRASGSDFGPARRSIWTEQAPCRVALGQEPMWVGPATGQTFSPRGGTVRSGGPGVRDPFLAEANLSPEVANALESLCGLAFPPPRSDGVLWRWRHL